MEKGVLKNFVKFTGKHLFQSLFYLLYRTPPGDRLGLLWFLVHQLTPY